VTPGDYAWPGARAYLQYAPEEFGRTSASPYESWTRRPKRAFIAVGKADGGTYRTADTRFALSPLQRSEYCRSCFSRGVLPFVLEDDDGEIVVRLLLDDIPYVSPS